MIDLQDRIRILEKKLTLYTNENGSAPNTEDMLRPGGFVRLRANDETPRFLGPSSGIAMTRLVMEEAKKYTDLRTIRELVPDLSECHDTSNVPTAGRKKSYPRISVLPAKILPSRLLCEKLVEVFKERGR